MKHILLSGLLLISLGMGQAHARELDYYLNLLDSHPKVQAVLEQQKALQQQAEGAMGLPDPSLFLGVDNVPVSDPSFDRFLPSAKVLGLTQNIPSSRSRKAQRDIFLSTATNTELLAEYTRSRLYALFFTRIAELRRVSQQTGYEERKKQTIAQLQDYYEGQIVAGQPMYQKTFLTEIEIAEVEQKLNTLLAEREFIEADLVQLVGEVPEVDGLALAEKQWRGELNDLYPVQLAARNIEVEQARVDLADSNYSPDFGVVATYKIREDGANDSFDGDDWFSLQFRMSIPLWASKSQRPKLEAARSGERSAQYGYREALRTWRMETTRLISEKQASLLNMDVLRKKDLALEMRIEAMERTYSAGQTSLEPVLQAELARLTLLAQIAGEQARYVRIAEELNSHIARTESHEIH